MKVTMLKTTNFSGSKEAGKQYEVPDHIAVRWSNRNIASIVEEEKNIITEDKEEIPSVDGYANIKAKTLYKMCLERGLNVNPKQSREVYIQALTESVSEQENDETSEVVEEEIVEGEIISEEQ